MFAKQNKRTYYARISRAGDFSHSSSSGDKKVSSDEILSSIQWLYERDGKVVIDFIDDETIQLTSLNTIEDDKLEIKLNEIKELIRDNLSSNT